MSATVTDLPGIARPPLPISRAFQILRPKFLEKTKIFPLGNFRKFGLAVKGAKLAGVNPGKSVTVADFLKMK